jgi:hypothetical protein
VHTSPSTSSHINNTYKVVHNIGANEFRSASWLFTRCVCVCVCLLRRSTYSCGWLMHQECKCQMGTAAQRLGHYARSPSLRSSDSWLCVWGCVHTRGSSPLASPSSGTSDTAKAECEARALAGSRKHKEDSRRRAIFHARDRRRRAVRIISHTVDWRGGAETKGPPRNERRPVQKISAHCYDCQAGQLHHTGRPNTGEPTGQRPQHGATSPGAPLSQG